MNFANPSLCTEDLCAQKNRLIEMTHLNTHNICFGKEIRKSLSIFDTPSLEASKQYLLFEPKS